jgi:cell wall-associated NlpC family hydrolase
MASFDDIKRGSLLGSRGEQLMRERDRRLGEETQEERSLSKTLEKRLELKIELEKKLSQARQKKKNAQQGQLSDVNDDIKNLQTLLAQTESSIVNTSENLGIRKQARVESIQTSFQQRMRSAVGERTTRSEISQAAGLSGNLGTASGMAQRMSSLQLEQQMARGHSSLAGMGERISELAERAGSDPGAETELRNVLGQRQRAISGIGLAQQAMGMQSKQGGTMGQQFINYNKLADAISQSRKEDSVRDKAAMGGLGSLKDTGSALKSAEDRLLSTIEKFNEALDKTPEKAGRLGKELDDLAQDVKDAQFAHKANVAAGGMGGSGILGGLVGALGSDAMRGAGIGAQAFGNFEQYRTVDSVLQQNNQRAQLAGLANQNFGDINNAISGDAASLRRVLTNMAEQQATGGVAMGNAMDRALNYQVGGQLTQLTAQGVKQGAMAWDPTSGSRGAMGMIGKGLGKFGRGATVVGGAVGAGGEWTGAMAPGIQQLGQNVIGGMRGIPQTDAMTSGSWAVRGLADQINKIPDFSMQSGLDYMKNITMATRGLGIGNAPGVLANYNNLNTQMVNIGAKDGGGAYAPAMRLRGTAYGQGVAVKPPMSQADLIAAQDTYDWRGDFERAERRSKGVGIGSGDLSPDWSPMDAFSAIGDMFSSPAATGVASNMGNVMSGGLMGTNALGLQASPETSPAVPPKTPAAPSKRSATKQQTSSVGDLGSYMDQWTGTPYVWGGATVNGIDCSGFAQKAMMAGGALPPGADKTMDRTAAGLLQGMQGGEGTKLDKDQEGALIFFRNKYGDKAGQVTHVGVGRGGGMMTDASAGRRGVQTRAISELSSKYETEYYMPQYGKFQGGAEAPEGGAATAHLGDAFKGGPGGTGGARSFAITTRQGGGDRENMMRMLASQAGRQRLANVGLTDKDVAQTVGAGRTALGKQMGFEDLEQMGQLRGIGMLESTQQGMQMRGQLSSVGVGREGFAQMLREAVAGGMDSSKNIGQMVQATTQLSASSAMAGRSTAAQTASMLAAGAQGSGLDPNMAIGAAANAMDAMMGITTDTGINLDTLPRMAAVNKRFTDADNITRTAITSLSAPAARKIMEGYKESQEAGQAAAAEYGVYGEGTKGISSMEDAQFAFKEAQRQTLRQMTGSFMDKRSSALVDKIVNTDDFSEKDLSLEERSMMNAWMRMNRRTSNVSLGAMLGMVKGDPAASGALPTAPGGMAGAGEDVTSGAPAMRDAKVLNDGLDRFESALGGIGNLGETLKAVAQNMNVTDLAKSTSQAANDMKVVSGTFSTNLQGLNNTIANFKTSLDGLINKMGASSGGGLSPNNDGMKK